MSSPIPTPKGRDQRFSEKLRRAIEHRWLAANKAKIDRLSAALYDDSLSDDEFLAAEKRFDDALNKGHRVLTRSVYRYHLARRPERRMLPRRDRRESHRTRPGHRRTGNSSATAGSDSGEDCGPGEPPGRRRELRHVSIPLADELNRIAARLHALGGVR